MAAQEWESTTRRPGAGTVGVLIVLTAAGLLFTTSAKTARGSQLRDDRGDLASLLKVENDRNSTLTAEVARLSAEVDARTALVANDDEEVARLRRDADPLVSAAGLSPVAGPALIVTLDDAPRDRQVPAGIKPDDLVVHQQDVQAVVNALWAGGAEAMMLQDQRVIATSAVRCVGNTLLLQGQVYSPPYRITAIGDPASMRRSLNASTEVLIYLQYVDRLGLGWDVQEKADQHLPGFAGPFNLRYARVPAATS